MVSLIIHYIGLTGYVKNVFSEEGNGTVCDDNPSKV
jgi:hypothetical protein